MRYDRRVKKHEILLTCFCPTGGTEQSAILTLSGIHLSEIGDKKSCKQKEIGEGNSLHELRRVLSLILADNVLKCVIVKR